MNHLKLPIVIFAITYISSILLVNIIPHQFSKLIITTSVIGLIILSTIEFLNVSDKLKTSVYIIAGTVFFMGINSFRLIKNTDFKEQYVHTKITVEKIFKSKNKNRVNCLVIDETSENKYYCSIRNINKIYHGDRFEIYGKTSKIHSTQIPNKFNFNKYLKSKNVVGKLKTDSVIRIKKHKYSALAISSLLEKKVEDMDVSNTSKSMIKAFVLGRKNGLTKDTKDNFSDSGLMHLLALSGLHVSVLVVLLNFLLFPLIIFNPVVNIKQIIILILIWAYAYITGFSAPITRTVIMFSYITIGHIFQRDTPISANLATALLILLIINPNNLFDIGFQLSFLAVTGIAWMYPKIKKSFKVRNKTLNYFWQLTAVSIAAQITTFPLIIFYFNKFSFVFLIANLFAIPIIFLVLNISYVLLFLKVFNIEIIFFNTILDWLTSLTNLLIDSTSELSFIIFNNIFLSKTEVILLYTATILLITAINTKSKKYIYLTLLIFISIQILKINSKINTSKNNKIIIAKETNTEILIENNGIYKTINKTENSIFNNYTIAHNLIETEVLNSEKNIFKADELYIVANIFTVNNSIKANHKLIVNTCVLNPNSLANKYTNEVIFKGKKSSIEYSRWKYFCIKNKILFHDLNDSVYTKNYTHKKTSLL